MKIEQLFVQHLYQQKQTALEGIGFFKLNADAKFPNETDKENSIAADAFSFVYNLKTPEDDTLVNYIVQQTGKIKPLAKSDLESYSMLSKQFLNLGKPLIIEGVGTLQINQKGEYEFTGGNFINPKIDDIFQQVKERKEDDVSFERENTNGKKRNNLMAGSIIGVIVLIGLVLFYFLIIKNNSPENKVTEIAVVNDTSIKAIKPADTLIANISKDTLEKLKVDTAKVIAPEAAQSQLVISSEGKFNIVLKDYNTQPKVQKAYNRLREWGHKVNIITIDSANFKLALSFSRPLTDTNKVKDSIRRFFGGKPYVLVNSN